VLHRPDRGQIYPQEPQGLGVDDVEAAASVYEDLGDGSRGPESGRERRPSYGPAEGLRTWWFGRGTPILLTVVASSVPGVVASVHPFLEAGPTVVTVLLIAEAVRGSRRPVPCVLGEDRGLPHASGGRCAML
jgi:hypothetical protein